MNSPHDPRAERIVLAAMLGSPARRRPRLALPSTGRSRAIFGIASAALIVGSMSLAAPSLAVGGSEVQPAASGSCATCRWNGADVDALLDEIAAARGEGLDPAAYDEAGLRALVAGGPGAALDRAAEATALLLARHYLLGRVADRARQSWFIARTDDDPAALEAGLNLALAAGRLRPWLRSLLPGDPRYAALRDVYAALPADAAADRASVRDNLERWRWLPRDLGASHIFVNVPSYTLSVVDGGVPVSTYDVVVGAPATPTPQISAPARTIVVNPSWSVPPSIVRSSGMQAGKPGFVTTVDRNGAISFNQPPGPRNALGRIKIDMPNPDAIYLHDTPAKSLFQRTSRAFSHGCIRVKDISRLAAELVRRDAGDARRVTAALSGYQTTPVRLHTARPVYIVYFTAEAGADGKLVRHDDPYGRDTRLSTTLAKLDTGGHSSAAMAEAAPVKSGRTRPAA